MAMWPSRFIFVGRPSDGVNPRVFPLAAVLVSGCTVPLALLFLDTLYWQLDSIKASMERSLRQYDVPTFYALCSYECSFMRGIRMWRRSRRVARQLGFDQGVPFRHPLEQHVLLAYRPYVMASSTTTAMFRVIPSRTRIGACIQNWIGFWVKNFAYLCNIRSEDLPVSHDPAKHVLTIIKALRKGLISHSRKRPDARLRSARSKIPNCLVQGISSARAVVDIPVSSALDDASAIGELRKVTVEEAARFEEIMGMKRKDVSINKVYDSRALRVIVGDKNGSLHGEAVRCCYNLLDIVHRLWTPIDGEFDDYIVNPKPSGYQSLHTAVQGPDNSPLEVQIRTQRMHEYAEHGLAAHWLYKETEIKLPSMANINDSELTASSYLSKDMDDQDSIEDDTILKYSSLKTGHPVLRVEGSQLLAAVIVSVDKGGRELLVAASFEQVASKVVADRRSSYQIERWEAYARLYKKVSDEWWCRPGHGDWYTCLEKYTLCRDGMYHKQDQFQRLLPTFIQVIDLTEMEETEYWSVMSAVFEGRQVPSVISDSSCHERPESKPSIATAVEIGINNKVQLLRTMLQWEEQLRSEASTHKSVPLGEVVIVCWPHGEVMRLRSGSTAADAARRVGLEGKLVSVNGHLVLPNTELKNGDVVEVRM
ncbi:GTP diphosphokinase [Sarracenia purpurea var. burkii]